MIAATEIQQFQTLVHSFNWTTPSWDLFVMLFWAVASVIYAFASGRGRVINILISVYVAKLMVLEAPFLTDVLNKKLNLPIVSLQQLATFVIIFLLLFLLGRYVFKTSADGRKFGSMLFGLIFSFLQIGLLINIVLGFLPTGVQNNFSPLVQTLFIRSPAGFVWLVLPIVYLIALGKFVGDSNEI